MGQDGDWLLLGGLALPDPLSELAHNLASSLFKQIELGDGLWSWLLVCGLIGGLGAKVLLLNLEGGLVIETDSHWLLQNDSLSEEIVLSISLGPPPRSIALVRGREDLQQFINIELSLAHQLICLFLILLLSMRALIRE